MGVPINNVSRRVVLAASGTGPYNFTFEILAATDIAVYRDDTLLTLTTDYTVTINANGTGYVTLTATPTGATQIAIVGNRTIQRTTDFVTGGDFFANTLNDELDQQTIFSQQNAEGLNRALQAPQTDPTSINMILPRASERANKTLNFDATGNPVAGLSVVATATANVATWLATPSSTNLRAAMTDETGTGSLVFANAPTFSGNPIISSGTANGVLYLNASKVATSGSALTFDGTNFATTGTASATKLIPTGGAATGNGMYLPAANTLAWSNNGSETMRLDTSGNLGLGVTPSNWGANYRAFTAGNSGEYVTVWGSSNTDGGANSYGQASIGNNITQSSKYAGTGTASYYVQSGGRHSWWYSASGTAGNSITGWTQAMTLDSSGNLGIGTTSPGAKLDVSSAGVVAARINNTASSSDAYLICKNTSGESFFGVNATGPYIYTATAQAMTFLTNNTERARITSGGDLLVPAAGSGSTGRISVRKDTGVPLAVSNEGVTGTLIEFSGNGSGALGSITHNGTNVAYNTSSDYRLKDNPQPLANSGSFIDALQPKTWNWKTDGSKGVGFIAHEVQAVSPNSVVGEKDAVDADGKPVMQAMEYGSAEFIANIIAELQSLRARVAALESKGA